MTDAPHYTMTPEIVNMISDIAELLGQLEGSGEYQRNLKLRKANRIKSIQSSLAIEANRLTLEEVTDIVNGKTILGKPKEIAEVKNAFTAYEHLDEYKPYELDSIMLAHKYMTNELVKHPGQFRFDDIGVWDGDRLIHPGARPPYIAEQIENLLKWCQNTNEHPLIVSSVFHFEFEYIHPFEDGNGRMGRLWQTVILSQWNELFAWLPVENIVFKYQQDYYNALEIGQKTDNAMHFILFMVRSIYESLQDLQNSKFTTDITTDITTDKLSRGERAFLEKIMKSLGAIGWISNLRAQECTGFSSNTVKEYLNKLVDLGVLEAEGKNKGRKYRLIKSAEGAKELS